MKVTVITIGTVTICFINVTVMFNETGTICIIEVTVIFIETYTICNIKVTKIFVGTQPIQSRLIYLDQTNPSRIVTPSFADKYNIEYMGRKRQ